MSFYVYILKSDSSGKSYIGHTQNLNNRVTEHNINKNKAEKKLIIQDLPPNEELH